MDGIIPGVEYELRNFNSDTSQKIRFVSKGPEGFMEGTTNEEVVNMMIDRFYSLQSKSFSVENQVIIEQFKAIRRQLAKRLTKKVEKLKETKSNEY